MASETRQHQEYRFETRYGARRRDRASALQQARVLAGRLQCPAPPDGGVQEPLVRYAQHVILNVEWYEQSMREQRRSRMRWISLFMILVLAVFGLFGAIVYGGIEDGSRSSMAEFAAILAGLVGLLKLLAQMSDSSRRMAGFHKARSALKQLLYSLENTWRGKTSSEGLLTPAFLDALNGSLAKAHEILDAEQAEFFASLATPAALLDGLSNNAERINAKVETILDARRQHSRRLQRQHALDEVLSARSEEVAARDSLQAALEIDPPDPAKIKEAQRTLVRAERARMATEALLEKIDAI